MSGGLTLVQGLGSQWEEDAGLWGRPSPIVTVHGVAVLGTTGLLATMGLDRRGRISLSSD